ncbi:MAG: ATP-binding protein [Bacillota bacterium]|nr:ATP-binding protein [Bacillota bacterium]
MKRRILTGVISLLVVFTVTAFALSAVVVRSVAGDQLLKQLEAQADSLAHQLLNRDEAQALEGLVTSSRVTLVDTDGEVLFDNWTSEEMDNHNDRPEILEARKNGHGKAVRFSKTKNSTMMYAARLLPGGKVLRVAAPEQIANSVVSGVLPYMIGGLIVILGFVIILSNSWTRSLLKPILTIDVERPEEAVTYDEILPLIKKIDQQNKKTQSQMEALEARRMELNALLDGMHEGFIALGTREEIILINPSACEILGVREEQARGRSLMEINRSPSVLSLLDNLRKKGMSDSVMELNGRFYLLFANRIESGRGAVVLISDQTYKIEAEAMRKQFTANVSHELRTPLTTICGYAEMLEKGMVKQEDVGQFYRLILRESSRMLTLVEDILRLSRLDEGSMAAQREAINLNRVAGSIAESLQLAADEKNVTLNYEGQDTWVFGVTTMLEELCSNLIDNAIKYNVDRGRVDVKVTNGEQAILTVSDTGIGIEPEHHDRVFERFYRTDKSRSKRTGGTGLGLSIVKHAAEFHKAKINLLSKPGKGTTITVIFPLYQEED